MIQSWRHNAPPPICSFVSDASSRCNDFVILFAVVVVIMHVCYRGLFRNWSTIDGCVGIIARYFQFIDKRTYADDNSYNTLPDQLTKIRRYLFQATLLSKTYW